jgi:hypothetical protein
VTAERHPSPADALLRRAEEMKKLEGHGTALHGLGPSDVTRSQRALGPLLLRALSPYLLAAAARLVTAHDVSSRPGVCAQHGGERVIGKEGSDEKCNVAGTFFSNYGYTFLNKIKISQTINT